MVIECLDGAQTAMSSFRVLDAQTGKEYKSLGGFNITPSNMSSLTDSSQRVPSQVIKSLSSNPSCTLDRELFSADLTKIAEVITYSSSNDVLPGWLTSKSGSLTITPAVTPSNGGFAAKKVPVTQALFKPGTNELWWLESVPGTLDQFVAKSESGASVPFKQPPPEFGSSYGGKLTFINGQPILAISGGYLFQDGRKVRQAPDGTVDGMRLSSKIGYVRDLPSSNFRLGNAYLLESNTALMPSLDVEGNQVFWSVPVVNNPVVDSAILSGGPGPFSAAGEPKRLWQIPRTQAGTVMYVGPIAP